MMCPAEKRFRKDINGYATARDFCAIFTAHTDDLYQLAFLLTADHEKAERCFVAGLEESVEENHVFKDWAHSWAKRAILRNAIRELRPDPHASSSALALAPYISPVTSNQGMYFDAGAILALETFERFVFAMSVLEQHSEHECSLLLGCSPRDIREARTRALAQLARSGAPALTDARGFGPRMDAFITPDDRKVAADR
jgi:DNA-directed RNA polymerase specialized sigma24 family protein